MTTRGGRQPRAFALALALAFLGCRDAAGPEVADGTVGIRTERTAYRPLDPVYVRTTNRTARTVYDDHCAGGLEGFEFLHEWNGSYGFGRACLWPEPDAWRTHSVAIPPGATHVDTLYVNGQAYSGTWRVALSLRDGAGDALPAAQRVSNTFRVRGGWTP